MEPLWIALISVAVVLMGAAVICGRTGRHGFAAFLCFAASACGWVACGVALS